MKWIPIVAGSWIHLAMNGCTLTFVTYGRTSIRRRDSAVLWPVDNDSFFVRPYEFLGGGEASYGKLRVGRR